MTTLTNAITYSEIDEGECEHPYSSKMCKCCGREFCWSCCGETNVHLGLVDNPMMKCPECGTDYYC